MDYLQLKMEAGSVFRKLNKELFHGGIDGPVQIELTWPDQTPQSTHKAGYGFVQTRKRADGTTRRLISIPSYLYRKSPEELIGVILHNMVHLYNQQNGLEPLGSGIYHNESFKESAERFGLKVFHSPKKQCGWGNTFIKRSPVIDTLLEEMQSSLEAAYNANVEIQPSHIATSILEGTTLIPPGLFSPKKAWDISSSLNFDKDRYPGTTVTVTALPKDGNTGNAVSLAFDPHIWDTEAMGRDAIGIMDSEDAATGEIAWQLYGNDRVFRKPFQRGILLTAEEIIVENLQELVDDPMLMRAMFASVFLSFRQTYHRIMEYPWKMISFAFLGLDTDSTDDDEEKSDAEYVAACETERTLLSIFQNAWFAAFHCVAPLTSDPSCYIAYVDDASYVIYPWANELHNVKSWPKKKNRSSMLLDDEEFDDEYEDDDDA